MKLFKWIGERKRQREVIAALQTQLAKTDEALKQLDAASQAQKEDLRQTVLVRDELAKMLSAERKQKCRVVKVAERAMPEDDLKAELAVDDEEPMWRAMHQLLDREIAKQVDVVTSVAGEKRIEAAGGIAALTDFQATLLDYQKAGLAAETAKGGRDE